MKKILLTLMALSSLSVSCFAQTLPDGLEAAATNVCASLVSGLGIGSKLVGHIVFGKTFQCTGGNFAPIGATIYPIQSLAEQHYNASGPNNAIITAYLFQDAFGTWKYGKQINNFQ